MTSPAAPTLTAEQYKDILETLDRNPTAANADTRKELQAFLLRRAAWELDARNRKLDNPW
jgi:hypothetical protein